MKIEATERLDCLFIHVPRLNNYYNPIGQYYFIMFVPMGIFAMADLLVRNQIKTKIIHFGIERINNPNFSVLEYIDLKGPKIIGLPIHWHHQSYDAVKMAEKIKRANKDIFIVAGGLTASFFHSEILEYCESIDAVIRGDGEEPMLKLARKISEGQKDFKNIPNLTWRNGKRIIENDFSYVGMEEDFKNFNYTNLSLLQNYTLYRDLVKIPWIWLKNLPISFNKRYLQKHSLFFITASKGCNANCSFCGGAFDAQKITSNRSKLIYRNQDLVVDSIQEVVTVYGYESIYMIYPDGSKNTEDYFLSLFDKIRRRGVTTRCVLDLSDTPSKRILVDFKRTFIDDRGSQIFVSPVSASERIRRINKGFYYSNESLFNLLENLEELSINTQVFFLTGLPFENMRDINETIKMRDKIRKQFKCVHSIAVDTINVEPASPMHMNPEKYKIKITSKKFSDFCVGYDKIKTYFEPTGYINPEFRIRGGTIPDYVKQIKKIKCRYFCRMGNYIIFKRFSLLPRFVCVGAGCFWKVILGGKNFLKWVFRLNRKFEY